MSANEEDLPPVSSGLQHSSLVNDVTKGEDSLRDVSLVVALPLPKGVIFSLLEVSWGNTSKPLARVALNTTSTSIELTSSSLPRGRIVRPTLNQRFPAEKRQPEIEFGKNTTFNIYPQFCRKRVEDF